MQKEPDLARAPLHEWFPWDCPECGDLWWYLPNARYDSSLMCEHWKAAEEEARKDRESLALHDFKMSSVLNRWWRAFFQASYEQGRRDGAAAVDWGLPKD